jgi:hypothetical protein
MSEEAKTFEVNVLIFRDDSEWSAVALEMNVRGYGASQQDARRDVIEMLSAQVTYAVQMGHPETVWSRAEQKYWQMWEQARRSEFVAEASGVQGPAEPVAESIPLSLLLSMKQTEKWTAASP